MDNKTIRPSGWYYGLAAPDAGARLVVIVIAVKRRQSKPA